MSDVVPVNGVSDGLTQTYHRPPTSDHLQDVRAKYHRPTSHHRPPHHQSTGPSSDRDQEWRPGDQANDQGDLERPTPSPGPGSGARGSPVAGVMGGGGCGRPLGLQVERRGVASREKASDASPRDASAADKSRGAENSENVGVGDMQTVPVKQKDLLKVVGRVQKHVSDSATSSTHLTDSGADCPCKSEVKELYIENASLRVRVKAIGAISEMLEINKKELETEKAKNAKLDAAVGHLQARLHRLGQDSSVDQPKEGIFLPGCDRTFVNSLILENGKLLKDLNELKKRSEVVPKSAKTEQVTCATVDLGQQLQEAKEQLHLREARISEFEAFVRSSDDVKTAKIVHLEDTCLRSRKELQDVEAICKVLTEETRNLQAELAASQLQLQSNRKELSEWKEKADNLDTKVLAASVQKMAIPKQSNLSLADQLKIAEGQVEQLDKENSRLTEQLREVIGMNTRWQRYNEQRETYVLKLTKTSQRHQSQITVLEQQKRDFEQTINGLNVMLQKLKEEQRKNTDAAILALEHQVAQREDRISEMAEELSALKMYIQGSQDQREPMQRPEDREKIQLLEQQIKAYREDFQQERRDRERAQTNNDVLKHRLLDATRKLTSYEQQSARMSAKFTTKLAGSAQTYQPAPKLIARGFTRPSRASDEEPYHVSDLEIDVRDETDGLSSNTEPLQCPRCAQEFPVENHSVFMRHVAVCLDQ